MSDDIFRIKQDTARGLSALKLLLDEKSSHLSRLEEKHEATAEIVVVLRERIATLEERLSNVRADVTGRQDLQVVVARTQGKEEAVRELKSEEKNEKQLSAERWKASAPIVVAIISSFSAIGVGILNLILHLVGS